MKKLKIILIIALVYISCTKSTEGVVSNGWISFENGEYTQALSSFWDATRMDDEYADAYNGLGWTYARLDSMNKSVINFEEAISLSPDLIDAHAGVAIVDNDYENAEARATRVINNNPDYTFTHDLTVTIIDIYLSRAHSRAVLGDFQGSLDDVNKVDSTFNADISTHQGRFTLMSKIEELLSEYSTY